MPNRPITILDRERNPVATADVESQKDFYSGSVNLEGMPGPLRRLFEEYEEIVNGQVFGLLDQIEERVDAASMSVSFDDGIEVLASNLQIFPNQGSISFTVVETATLDDRQ